MLAAYARHCCQLASAALKRSRSGLNINPVKLFRGRPVLPVAPQRSARISKVLTAMKRVLSALVLMSGAAVVMPAPPPAFAAAPIPELGGAPVPSLAPMLARITPGVVGVSVRGRVREENPLLQDPFFRRFFNLPQRQQQEERETQATGSRVIVDA